MVGLGRERLERRHENRQEGRDQRQGKLETYLVAGVCIFTGPMGRAAASGINMLYKLATGQYANGLWRDAIADATLGLGGLAVGRVFAGSWRARNVVQYSGYGGIRAIGKHRAVSKHRGRVNYTATRVNWSNNYLQSVGNVAAGTAYADAARRRNWR